jgi:hypothetical protein
MHTLGPVNLASKMLPKEKTASKEKEKEEETEAEERESQRRSTKQQIAFSVQRSTIKHKTHNNIHIYLSGGRSQPVSGFWSASNPINLSCTQQNTPDLTITLP